MFLPVHSCIHPVLQVVTGSESQVRSGVMKRLTGCTGSCRGPTSSSRPSNWPEKDFLSLQSKVASSRTSIQTPPRNYGTNDSTARSRNHNEQHVTCLHLTFCLCVSVRELFSDQSGNLLKAGDIVKFKKLADTLEVIAEKGADGFYSGRIAQDLISDIQEAGIVRRALFLPDPFSISAATMILLHMNKSIKARGALQRSLSDSRATRPDPLKVLITWSRDAFSVSFAQQSHLFQCVCAQEEH